MFKIPRAWGTLRRLVAAAQAQRPDALVVVDFPDFNFPLARQIKNLGVPVVYYISPQIWAWRPGRLKTIGEIADRMLVIFPFEEEIYRDAGVPVDFVGHPLVDLARASGSREDLRARLGLSIDAPTVAILPGSRPNEVARILTDLLKAAILIRAREPRAQFAVARAPNLENRLFNVVRHLKGPPIHIFDTRADDVLAASDVALTASGTATVQAALHDTPMVIVYRLSPITYMLGRPFVRVDTFGMVNLIAGETIVPELIQNGFTPEAVAQEAVAILMDRDRAARIRRGLARVRERLGAPEASRRAAEAILRVATRRTI